MAFECETAAALDGWSDGVQSDEMGKRAQIILLQTFHFKFIQNKCWTSNSRQSKVEYILMIPLKNI